MEEVKQQEIDNRFYERFLKRVENPLGWRIPRIAYFWEQSGKDVEWEDMEIELKSFVQSEISLAVKQERERSETLFNEKVAQIEDLFPYETKDGYELAKRHIIAILKQ